MVTGLGIAATKLGRQYLAGFQPLHALALAKTTTSSKNGVCYSRLPAKQATPAATSPHLGSPMVRLSIMSGTIIAASKKIAHGDKFWIPTECGEQTPDRLRPRKEKDAVSAHLSQIGECSPRHKR
jgi:hypothetical protein